MIEDFFKKEFKPEIEEDILAFWEREHTFEKSLEKTRAGTPFTFYDGPPFATGTPHYGHILSSTIKDVVGRYQTMKGRYVRRRWGWDCHGLPIEELVERELGISGKKKIENEIGIGKFNETCRNTVLKYVSEWREMVRRIARWVDFDNSYKTMDRDYMESVWWAFKQMHEKGLVYEGRKVLLYCPRCETPVSNFEVAMDNSYKTITEEAVTVKFKIKNPEKINLQSQNAYLLAWTTTPWTLPGNVALAVNLEKEYGAVQHGSDYIVAAVDRLQSLGVSDRNVSYQYTGRNLIGLEYEPLFDVPAVKSDKSYKVYAADFVTTEEGTGIVHTAVVYGEDDYNLGVKEGLPVVPLLDEKGIFNDKAPELVRGEYFKKADKLVIKDLETRRLLFAKAPHAHAYPHCWRCDTALFYNAIPAWFVNIQKIKKDLLKSNQKQVNWFPEHLKAGRYAKSMEQAPDWNISRNRYWGNPIPVWKCESCGKNTVVGSIKELGLERNEFWFARHGMADNNVKDICVGYSEPDIVDLTPEGRKQAEALGKRLRKEGIDLIVASDVRRTKHTAEIVGNAVGCPVEYDARLREWNFGAFHGKPCEEMRRNWPPDRRWKEALPGGESWTDVQKRMVEAVRDLDAKHRGKKILVISHGDPLLVLGLFFGAERGNINPGETFRMDVSVPDIHRPFIDEVSVPCACGGTARRVKEIFDSWVEAGSMPFAEYHYPFEQEEVFKSRLPAQFVAEYIAQTRAWFYVMHVLSLILFSKAPFENVVTTGTILAEDGTKMSKSKKNFPNPWEVIRKYGVDSLRLYLMNSVVMQAENLNFSESDLQGMHRKVLLILSNVRNYFTTYAREAGWKKAGDEEGNILDQWIGVRTKELVNGVTECLDKYDTVRATRNIEEYVADLSTWYLRRSRGRKDAAFFATFCKSLETVSTVIAPFMPYLAEHIFQSLREFTGINVESAHLADWPEQKKIVKKEAELLRDMAFVRDLASKALALRKAQNIPVRQPLAALKVKGPKLKPELLLILAEEVNVKKVEAAPKLSEEVVLDTALTEELKLEGLVRGLERLIQELRKKQGLKVGEITNLQYSTADLDLKRALALVNKKKTYISEVEEVETSEGETSELEGKSISLKLHK